MSRSEFVMPAKESPMPMIDPQLIVLVVTILSVLLILGGTYRVLKTIYYWFNVCLQGWMRYKESEKED